MTKHVLSTTVLAAVMAWVSPADAGSHTWRFNEVFSNQDGSVQFIEMRKCCGGLNEVNIGGKDVTAASGPFYTFPANIGCVNCTANAHILLATQSFADLPGAPTPDHIIPEGFFQVGGETLMWHVYGPATWSFGAGVLPVDGVTSLNNDLTTGVNSPTNLGGASGSVTAPCKAEDVVVNGQVDVADLLRVLADWTGCGSPCPSDVNDDGLVNVTDLLRILAEWNSC